MSTITIRVPYTITLDLMVEVCPTDDVFKGMTNDEIVREVESDLNVIQYPQSKVLLGVDLCNINGDVDMDWVDGEAKINEGYID